MEFIEAPLFTRLLPDYLTDDEYAELQLHLANDPEAGDVIPGTGGFRKVRWADRRRGQGRKGWSPRDCGAHDRPEYAGQSASDPSQRAIAGACSVGVGAESEYLALA